MKYKRDRGPPTENSTLRDGIKTVPYVTNAGYRKGKVLGVCVQGIFIEGHHQFTDISLTASSLESRTQVVADGRTGRILLPAFFHLYRLSVVFVVDQVSPDAVLVLGRLGKDQIRNHIADSRLFRIALGGSSATLDSGRDLFFLSECPEGAGVDTSGDQSFGIVGHSLAIGVFRLTQHSRGFQAGPVAGFFRIFQHLGLGTRPGDGVHQQERQPPHVGDGRRGLTSTDFEWAGGRSSQPSLSFFRMDGVH